MSTQPKPFISEEQYLEIERRAEQRSEYYRGDMFPMEATIQRARINGNLFRVLARELAGSGCEAFVAGLRVRIPTTGLYTYPDVVVLCGEPELAAKDRESVTNPRVIVEVLSPSTEDYDRGKKLDHYRSLPSFVEYLLVAQDRIRA